MELTLAETFAGIGGWSEAARMAGGIRPIWRSEIHPYKNKVYELRHPGVPNLGDIRNIHQAPYADIFTVSFPCTGISSAGKHQGFADKGSGLWFEAERIIGESRPRYIVIENGPILNKRGLDRILAALAGFGYDAEWTHLSGSQFGVQQRRKRLYLIANTNQVRCSSSINRGVLFRKLQAGGISKPVSVSPGWAERRDIPKPRTFGSAHDLPSLVHRLECVGDAIIPLIGMYILECIKLHHSETFKTTPTLCAEPPTPSTIF